MTCCVNSNSLNIPNFQCRKNLNGDFFKIFINEKFLKFFKSFDISKKIKNLEYAIVYYPTMVVMVGVMVVKQKKHFIGL